MNVSPSSSCSNSPVQDLGAVIDTIAVLGSVGEAVYCWDMISDRLAWSGNAASVLRIANPAALSCGRSYAGRLLADARLSRWAAVQNADGTDEGEGVPFHVVYPLVDDTGLPVWIEDIGRWFAGSDGRPHKVHGVVRDVTGRHEESCRREEAARIDVLTGALTRQALFEHVAGLLTARAKQSESFAVLLVTVDNLALVNANYGYDVADSLIAGVARRLREQMRANDVIARYTGNRIALVLDACDTELLDRAAERFIGIVMAEPIPTSVGELDASLRIGVALQPNLSRGPETLLKQAEEALDHARDNVMRRWAVYSPDLNRENARSWAAQVSREVHEALAHDRIELAFQPIVSSCEGRPVWYEALMRIRRADGSLIPPQTILPTTEKLGLVQLLDQRVLELALKTLAANPWLTVAINVSPSTAHAADWAAQVGRAIDRFPGTGRRLMIELTEARALENVDATGRAFAELRALGVRVAMDDFGAGHTSFKNLRNLDVDVLKIDGGFIANLASSEEDRFFAHTLVTLAQRIAVPVVAEWVEDQASVEILRDWGVEYLQGYFFGAAGPLPQMQTTAPIV